ncbi:MAG: DNA methyltransferase [Candidatus Brocadiaceae baterium WH-1]|nr:MAG: DNA methyltransferase [Candidatus Jettenia sp. AMX2]
MIKTKRYVSGNLRNSCSEAVFTTLKPERLIQRILTLATNEGDLVFDSFLGSGTTAAVWEGIKGWVIPEEMQGRVYQDKRKKSGKDNNSKSHNKQRKLFK